MIFVNKLSSDISVSLLYIVPRTPSLSLWASSWFWSCYTKLRCISVKMTACAGPPSLFWFLGVLRAPAGSGSWQQGPGSTIQLLDNQWRYWEHWPAALQGASLPAEMTSEASEDQRRLRSNSWTTLMSASEPLELPAWICLTQVERETGPAAVGRPGLQGALFLQATAAQMSPAESVTCSPMFLHNVAQTQTRSSANFEDLLFFFLALLLSKDWGVWPASPQRIVW